MQAVEMYLSTVTKPSEQTEAAFEDAKAVVRGMAGPAIRIYGSRGETATALTEDIFDNLPETVTEITFESNAALQSHNIPVLNKFTLTFDFSETAKIPDYNPSGESTPNRSHIQVLGDDTAWVNGVYETVMSFLRDSKRKRKWGWIHSRYTYNLLHAVVALPAGIWAAYRLDGWLTSVWEGSNIVVRSAIFLYAVLFVLWLYQGAIGVLRWAFPVVELEGSRANILRVTAGGIVGSLLLALIYDVLKVLATG